MRNLKQQQHHHPQQRQPPQQQPQQANVPVAKPIIPTFHTCHFRDKILQILRVRAVFRAYILRILLVLAVQRGTVLGMLPDSQHFGVRYCCGYSLYLKYFKVLYCENCKSWQYSVHWHCSYCERSQYIYQNTLKMRSLLGV